MLLVMYGHLAISEKREMGLKFGGQYQRYAEKNPRFIPRWSAPQHHRAEKLDIALMVRTRLVPALPMASRWMQPINAA